ncbi:hypothetical protein DY000_02062271 [Brassica cretica]|uniref:Uncharacterized protein n=1 Tax=Brassica cretica TaxID=69181 RepID=A0ABQ7AZP3_BRACR|nr:hypothetical protein DY000_02062271 [Brassica cretica]
MLFPTRNITVLVLFLYRWWLQHRTSSDSRENRWKFKLMTLMNLLATRHSRFSRKPLFLATSGFEIDEEMSSDCHQALASASRELSRQAGHHQHKLLMIISKRHGVISFTITHRAKEKNRAKKQLPPPYVLMLRKMALSHELIGNSTSRRFLTSS